MLQWLRDGRVINDGAAGEEMWINGHYQKSAVYYHIDQTHEASPGDLEAHREEQRAKRRERARKQKEAKKAAEKAAKAAERARVDRLMARLRRYRDVDPAKTICLDVETTGLIAGEDEILQLSIIDGTGAVLLNEYIRPQHATEWPEAAAINGITPEMVAVKPTIDAHLPRIQAIVDAAELIIGYNSDGFDLPFLRAAGVQIRKKRTFDVMLEFAELYGEWDEYHRDWKWQKLSTCAAFFGYTGDGAFHDSLEDVRATLYCYKKMGEVDLNEDQD